MTLSWFAVLWLLVALICMLIGAALSERQRAGVAHKRDAHTCCQYCGAPGEPDASFCGLCGEHLHRDVRPALKKQVSLRERGSRIRL
jgi:predicted amidophosphoribosyltransferase